MREARLIPPGVESVVHCSNRTVNDLRKFGSKEIAQLRALMFRVFDYSGFEVLAYAVVPTGYDVMLRIPKPARLSDSELTERAARLYEREPDRLSSLRWSLAEFNRRTPSRP